MSVSGIDFKFNIGGEDKKFKQLDFKKNWQGDSEDRVWGKFFNLYQDKKMKLKELIIDSKERYELATTF